MDLHDPKVDPNTGQPRVTQLEKYEQDNAIGTINNKTTRDQQFQELYIQNQKHEFFKTYHCVETNLIRLFCKDEAGAWKTDANGEGLQMAP